MGASLLPIEDLSDADVGAWRELADAALEPNPFYDPDFVLPAVSALRAVGIGLLVSRGDGGWTACLPVRRSRGWHRMPMSGLVAWRHLYSFLGTPLVRPGVEREALRGLLEAAFAAGGFVGLSLISTDGPVAAALDSALADLELRAVELDRFQRATLERREEPLYLALSPKRRRNFERLRRRFQDFLGAELSLRDRAGEPDAPEDFLRLEASGWKGLGEGGTATAMAPAGHAGLFNEICDRFARRGALHLFTAESGGTPAAMLCDLVAGDTGFTFKIAVEAEYVRFSPGVQLEILMLEAFHADQRLRMLDSCADPDNEMINRLWPDRREIGIRAVPAPGLRGGAARSGLKALGWVRRRRS